MTKHGRTIKHDTEYNIHGQLIDAVKQLIRPDHDRDSLEQAFNATGFTVPVGWDLKIFSKMIGKPYKERLVIAPTAVKHSKKKYQIKKL